MKQYSYYIRRTKPVYNIRIPMSLQTASIAITKYKFKSDLQQVNDRITKDSTIYLYKLEYIGYNY